MADEEPIREIDGDEPTPEDVEEAQEPRRSLWGLVAIITVVIVIIIVLLQLRRCGSASGDASERAGKTIEAVKGHDTVDGAVSLWIAEGANVRAVLADAGVTSSGQIDMDKGRWVITVPGGSEKASIGKLSATEGVHDAGYVYER